MDVTAHGTTKMVARGITSNDLHRVELEIHYNNYSPQEHKSTFNLFFKNGVLAHAYAAAINSVSTDTAKEVSQ